jgi:hypothetical protein
MTALTSGGRTLMLTLAAGVLLAAGGFLGARVAASHAKAPVQLARGAAPPVELLVPHAGGAILLDGDTDDPGWHAPIARTGAFAAADGSEARPYSDVKMAWGDGHLYLMLYAGDEDIEATHASESAVWLDDSFHLVFSGGEGQEAFDVSAIGAMTDGARRGTGPFDWSWQSGAHVSHDMDEGTANDPRDADEEWVIEMAIPFESLGLEGKRGERIGFAAHRCDTPKQSHRMCGSFGEGPGGVVLVLD